LRVDSKGGVKRGGGTPRAKGLKEAPGMHAKEMRKKTNRLPAKREKMDWETLIEERRKKDAKGGGERIGEKKLRSLHGNVNRRRKKKKTKERMRYGKKEGTRSGCVVLRDAGRGNALKKKRIKDKLEMADDQKKKKEHKRPG